SFSSPFALCLIVVFLPFVFWPLDCSVISLKQNRSVPRELRTRHNIPGNINRFIEIATGEIRRRRDDNEGSRRRLMACRESYCPTCAHHRPMSAFGGKADMAIALRNVRF